MTRDARGQTMVLMSLALFLLTLMVCMTLSFATKAKEKMEVQTVADAAAYSNAVVTARVFNEISLMNRAIIAELVSMAGVQSLISYSSFYRAQVEASRKSYNIAKLPYIALLPCCIPTSGCTAFCKCAIKAIKKISDQRKTLADEETRINGIWDAADDKAAEQVRDLQSAARRMWLTGQMFEYGRLQLDLRNQTLARKVMNSVRGSGPFPAEWTAPSGADGVTVREADPYIGAVDPFSLVDSHQQYATMGSRGWTFTLTRGTAGLVISSRLTQLVAPDAILATDKGSGYFASSRNHGAKPPSGVFSWADDHGINVTTFTQGEAPCPPISAGFAGGVNSTVKSTDSGDSTDQHDWKPQGGSDASPQTRHTLGVCGSLNCPGMWPYMVDYNSAFVINKRDNYGQPKNYAVIQRDYGVRGVRADPWNLLFKFRFTPAGADFRNDGLRLGPRNGNTDISKQTALAAGIAYYHRGRDTFGDHWAEPPNFLNPFWRATLVPADTDFDGESDPVGALNSAGVPWAADAYSALRGQGYKGF